jgi:hypothetical protein
MRRWLLMTGGLLIWAAHFMGVYAISSLGDVVQTADAPGWRMAALGFSAACAAAAGVLLAWVARKAKTTPAEGLAPFVVSVGFLGGLVALIGVIWQALPTVIGAA